MGVACRAGAAGSLTRRLDDGAWTGPPVVRGPILCADARLSSDGYGRGVTAERALEPELVPEPLWQLSAYSMLPRSRWQAIRRAVIEEFGSRCAACGEVIERGATCHELWGYDEQDGVARRGLALICRPCNGVHHFGQAGAAGWGDAVLDQLAKVNAVEPAEARAILRAATDTWRRRSRRGWTITVDRTLLERFPDLRVLDGLTGSPGDGRRRLREDRGRGVRRR